jgi:hypothetical protein
MPVIATTKPSDGGRQAVARRVDATPITTFWTNPSAAGLEALLPRREPSRARGRRRSHGHRPGP